jgi:hypothetical protein
MDEEAPTPLSPIALATVEELIDELRLRFPGGFVVGGVKDAPGRETSEITYTDWGGSNCAALGLAELLRAKLRGYLLTPGEETEGER